MTLTRTRPLIAMNSQSRAELPRGYGGIIHAGYERAVAAFGERGDTNLAWRAARGVAMGFRASKSIDGWPGHGIGHAMGIKKPTGLAVGWCESGGGLRLLEGRRGEDCGEPAPAIIDNGQKSLLNECDHRGREEESH